MNKITFDLANLLAIALITWGVYEAYDKASAAIVCGALIMATNYAVLLLTKK